MLADLFWLLHWGWAEAGRPVRRPLNKTGEGDMMQWTQMLILKTRCVILCRHQLRWAEDDECLFFHPQSLDLLFCYLRLISQDWLCELSKSFHIKRSNSLGLLRAHFRMRVTSNSLIFQKHTKRCVGQTLVNRKPLHKLGGLIYFLTLLLFC